MKSTRKVTYRGSNTYEYYPCIILEGKWLTKKYGWKIGDVVKIEYGEDYIKISRR